MCVKIYIYIYTPLLLGIVLLGIKTHITPLLLGWQTSLGSPTVDGEPGNGDSPTEISSFNPRNLALQIRELIAPNQEGFTGGCVPYPSSHDHGTEHASLNSSYLSDAAILHFQQSIPLKPQDDLRLAKEDFQATSLVATVPRTQHGNHQNPWALTNMPDVVVPFDFQS